MDRDFEITTGPDGLPTQTFNGKTYKLWPNKRYFTRRQSITMHTEVWETTVKLKHLEQGEKWEAIGSGMRFTCYFNSNLNVVAGGSNTNITTFTPPAGVAYVRVSMYHSDLSLF